jgi:hypothetical protein
MVYKIDSGAFCSTIDITFLQSLGYSLQYIKQCPKMTFSLAAKRRTEKEAEDKKESNGYFVTLPWIKLAGACIFRPVFITSIEHEMHFLLGMNILQMFDWDINFTKAEFNFYKRKPATESSRSGTLLSPSPLRTVLVPCQHIRLKPPFYSEIE